MTLRMLRTNGFDGLRALVHDESGQDLIEYVMLVALLALGTLVATQTMAGAVIDTFWQRIAGMLAGLLLA